MSDKQYVDIKVIEGGWDIDAGQQPEKCSDLYSIAQDVKHAIMESGLLNELIGERNPTLRYDVLIQIEQMVENDVRIIPGTANVIETNATGSQVQVTGEAYEYGKLEVTA